MFNWLPLPTSILAFITTIHFAMLVLRVHRSPAAGIFSFVTPVSLMLVATPWLMPTQLGIAMGLAAHVGWFAACERLLPVPIAAPRAAAAAPPRPPSPVRVSAPTPVIRPAAPAARPAAPAPRSAASPAPVPTAAPGGKPRDFVQVPILEVLDETHDIRTFRMARPEGFEFQAGQFLTVRVRSDGKEHVRCYSISSPPEARGHMEISVKRLGSISGTLHATVRPGSFLSVRAPAGAFVYPTGDDRPIVLIAGGVGITPLMAMLRHAVNAEPTRRVTLLYSVRTEPDVAFLDEIRVLERRHSQFRAVIAISDVEVTSEGLFPGRITAEFISGAVPDVSHARCFICGPPPMLDVVTDLLASIGVPKAQIHFEIFSPAIAAAAGAPVRERPVPAAQAAAADFEVRFERSGVTARIPQGQTLLEAAEGCNASIPSLCRVGVCGTCRTRVVSGDAECASQTLDAQDRADGFILPCVTHIHSDCVVEG